MGMGGSMGAADVAGCWDLCRKNDQVGFVEMELDVKVFVKKVYYLAEIAGQAEKLGGSNTCHYAHIPMVLKN